MVVPAGKKVLLPEQGESKSPATLTNSHGLGDRGYAVGKLGRGLPCAKPGPGKGTPHGKSELEKTHLGGRHVVLDLDGDGKSLLFEFVVTDCPSCVGLGLNYTLLKVLEMAG